MGCEQNSGTGLKAYKYDLKTIPDFGCRVEANLVKMGKMMIYNVELAAHFLI
jgi:hypothetical protein